MTNNCLIEKIDNWFSAAKPEPTEKDFSVQLGNHVEEIVEMLDCMSSKNSIMERRIETVCSLLIIISESLKNNEGLIDICDSEGFLDSLCDQVVTAVGSAKFAGHDFIGAIKEVNDSNYSKFVDGKAILDERGKIAKGPNYFKPNLRQYLNT